jgi:hypothetical protein
MTQADIDRPTEPTAGRLQPETGVAMNAPDTGPPEHKSGSAETRRLVIAVISAGACVGVAAIAVALSFLF